jgi:hypothetical protein
LRTAGLGARAIPDPGSASAAVAYILPHQQSQPAQPDHAMHTVLRSLGSSLLLACVLSAAAYAQGNALITENMLRGPWEAHTLLLQSMAPAISTASGMQRRTLADQLSRVQVTLGEYETQVDEVIDRIIGDPQYGYVATETSRALAVQLGEIGTSLDELYATLGARSRSDVQPAQASLSALRDTLAGARAFERDLYGALGSGSRQQIVELATRWWKGEEQAIVLKKLVTQLRSPLEGVESQ